MLQTGTASALVEPELERDRGGGEQGELLGNVEGVRGVQDVECLEGVGRSVPGEVRSGVGGAVRAHGDSIAGGYDRVVQAF